MSVQLSIASFLLRRVGRPMQIGLLRPLLVRRVIHVLACLVPVPMEGLGHEAVAADPERSLCPAEWLSVARPERTIVYFHGGGYFFGGLGTHRPACALLARYAKACVLSVDYRMAPEHHCPAPVEDGVAWWRELVRKGVDPANVVFAGDSAGAGLATAVMVSAREQGLPMPAGAVLFSPFADMSCSGESMISQRHCEQMFVAAMVPQAAALYLNGRPATDPLASPVFADLRGLPELFMFASQHEILLSDATRLHDNARKQGVTSTLTVRPKMPHVWPILVVLPEGRADLMLAARFAVRATTAQQSLAA
jgi:monoterpene epsilon-lactone hydrolase